MRCVEGALEIIKFGLSLLRVLLQLYRIARMRAVLRQSVVSNFGNVRLLLPHHHGAHVLLWLEFPRKPLSIGDSTVSIDLVVILECLCNGSIGHCREGKMINLFLRHLHVILNSNSKKPLI
jgi:hypothetical protein